MEILRIKAKGEGGGSGAGGGMGVAPIGFLVTRGDQISFISTHTNKGLGAAFEKVPDLLEKFMEKKKQKKEEAVGLKKYHCYDGSKHNKLRTNFKYACWLCLSLRIKSTVVMKELKARLALISQTLFWIKHVSRI